MRKLVFGATALVVMSAAGGALAESFEDICLRVSDEWGTSGDVGAQCSCLADKTGSDPALDAELRSLADAHSSDQEAYDAASDGAKAALDACSVDS